MAELVSSTLRAALPTEKPLAGVLVEGDDGGDDGRAVFAGNDGGRVALHEGDEGVGGAEVDTDDWAPTVLLVFLPLLEPLSRAHSLLNTPISIVL